MHYTSYRIPFLFHAISSYLIHFEIIKEISIYRIKGSEGSRREREEKVSWAEATSQLLTNWRLSCLSLLRDNTRCVLHPWWSTNWCRCAGRSGERWYSRCTTTHLSDNEMIMIMKSPVLPSAQFQLDPSWSRSLVRGEIFCLSFQSYLVLNLIPLRLWTLVLCLIIESPSVERASLNPSTVSV